MDSPNRHNFDPDGEEKRLDRLAGRVLATESPFVRPTDEAILAYLRGKASADERDAVQKAVLAAEDFRRELIELAADLERLDDAARARFDALPEPEVPDRYAAVVSTPASAAPGRAATRARLRLAWTMAAAALVVIAVLLFGRPTHETTATAPWERHELGLTPDLFMPVTLRGAEEDEGPYASEAEAALTSFVARIQWEQGAFFATGDVGARGLETAGPALVQLVDQRDRVVLRYQPAAEGPCAQMRVWLLALPDLALFSISLPGCSSRIKLPPAHTTELCVAMTYTVPGGYLGTRAVLLGSRQAPPSE